MVAVVKHMVQRQREPVIMQTVGRRSSKMLLIPAVGFTFPESGQIYTAKATHGIPQNRKVVHALC